MKILHIFDHTLPLHSGYTFRSMAILKAQRALGWQTLHLSSPRHGQSAAQPVEPAQALDSEDVDGFRFWRTATSQSALSRTPAWPIAEMAATTARLRALVAQQRPDILHAHSPALNAHPALRVGRETGLPVIYEVRGFWEDAAVDHGTTTEGSLRYRLGRWLETRALRQADQVTAICNGLKQDMIGRGIAESRISLIPNAVDVERFTPITAPKLALQAKLGLAGHWVIGFCGSFYSYEGLDLLLDAMPALVKQLPQLRLLLVGGGPEDAALRAQVQRLGLQAFVIFTGRVPNAEVEDYYSLIDVLVFPRKPMRLTELVTPLKPLEAMAQGLPVLASDVGGHRELIRHGETGMLFRAGDAAALAEAVLALQRDPALVQRLKQQGRAYVIAERSWQRSVEQYKTVYANALGAHPRRARSQAA